MEPLNDRELDELLRQWRAPLAPTTLEARVRRATGNSWWQWLWAGSVRLPVPALLAAVLAIVLLFIFGRELPVRKTGPGFRPVKEVQVRIVRSNYESDR